MRRCMIAIALVLALAGSACSPDTGPQQAATDYLVAIDNGDKEGQCALEERSQSTKERQHCIDIASEGVHGYAEPPRVDRVEDWPSTGGKAVIIEESLTTTDTPQWVVVGVVEVDGRWLVREFRSIDGDPTRDGAGTETLG